MTAVVSDGDFFSPIDFVLPSPERKRRIEVVNRLSLD